MTANRAALALAVIAGLAAGSTAAGQTPTTPTAAAPPQTAATPPKTRGFDPNSVICKRDVPTGTMFAKTVCLTSAEWDQNRQEDVNAIRRNSAVPQPPSGMMGH